MRCWRHVINDTVFTWSAPNQIAIFYPWQEKYGQPVRPLFSATYANEHGYEGAFPFETEQEFRDLCKTHAEARPYLVEPAPKK